MVLELKGISKQFFGNTVLSNIDLGFSPGKIHALVGENGAGKSTLIKIIGGNYHADAGSIFIDGNPVSIATQHQAAELGIHIVYQEYNLVRNMTVLDNILLGREPTGKFHLIKTQEARRQIQNLAEKYSISLDLDRYAADLSSAEAKLAEILRACSYDMRILILDEPTAALGDDDVKALFRLLETLRRQGTAIIYISHRLDEVFRICDSVSVLKDGVLIDTWRTKAIDHDTLITSMVGRELKDIFPPGVSCEYPPEIREEDIALRVDNLGDGGSFHDITFNLKKGEILGIGGMSGHGQRELIRSLFGIHPVVAGSITIGGEGLHLKEPSQAVAWGLAFLSDDRRNEGLAPAQSTALNIAYPSLKLRSRMGIVKRNEDSATVINLIKKLRIKVSSPQQTVRGLSGGNQQRVTLAKWLPMQPRLLLFHEPTLGIDVGAKAEIYSLLREFTREGLSIIMVTSDMLELINMTDRIIVMYEGRIQAKLESGSATEEIIMTAASGKYDSAGNV